MNSRFFNISERILLTFWVGSMWSIGYIAAPVLFKFLDDRVLAGTLAGHMFTATSYIGLACGVLLLLNMMYQQGRQAIQRWRLWLIVSMLLLVAVGEFALHPMMAELRVTGLVGEGAKRFALLHGISSTVFLVTSLAGLILVIFDTGDRAGDFN